MLSCPVTTVIAILHTDGLEFSLILCSVTAVITPILRTDHPLDYYLSSVTIVMAILHNDGHSALSKL